MSEGVWLGFVILTNIISLTSGQLPITPAGTLSQRDIIKNQMRNVFSGRSGYIPILSYLRVRGGSISGVSPGKANPQFSTTRPAGPVSGKTVDSEIQFRNGLKWIYMVPKTNGQIFDERRILNMPVKNNAVFKDISTPPSASLAVPQNPDNRRTQTTLMNDQINLKSSLSLNWSAQNRSAISSSFGKVSTDSNVEDTNNGTKPPSSGTLPPPRRVGKNPRRLPVTVPFSYTTNVPLVQAGPATSVLTVSSNAAIESATNLPNAQNGAYLSFSVKPPTNRVRQGTLGPFLQPTNNSTGGRKTGTNVTKTLTNSGNGFVNTLFQDRGPPIAGSVTDRTIDVNPVGLGEQFPSIIPGTLNLNATTEPSFNSTTPTEALDLYNLTELYDFYNVTIGLSVLDFNDTMLNDSFNGTMLNDTTTDSITTTSLPTTTPFGSLNALCGAHLVGHPDMPPHPTTTASDYMYVTYAPRSQYRFPWHNPLHPEYEPPEPSEAPEYEIIPGQNPAAPASAASLPIGQCFCFEKAECEGIGATQGLPYEYMCDISAGLSCCCEPS